MRERKISTSLFKWSRKRDVSSEKMRSESFTTFMSEVRQFPSRDYMKGVVVCGGREGGREGGKEEREMRQSKCIHSSRHMVDEKSNVPGRGAP